MKKYSVLFVLCTVSLAAFAQLPPERHDVRKGNKAYKKGDYRNAETEYRRGLEKDTTSFGTRYNLANAFYKQEQYEQAGQLFGSLKSDEQAGESGKAQLFHNLGNAQLQQKQYAESIASFKQSLRLNPSDTATRANLAYAQLMLQNQQNQPQNQPQNNQDNQKDKQEDNKDPQQDPQNNQDNKDPQPQDNPQDDKQDSPQQQQQSPPKISPQDAQRMLEAVQADERDTQEKVNKEKAKAAGRQSIEKNW